MALALILIAVIFILVLVLFLILPRVPYVGNVLVITQAKCTRNTFPRKVKGSTA
jgi:hypothetical protein